MSGESESSFLEAITMFDECTRYVCVDFSEAMIICYYPDPCLGCGAGTEAILSVPSTSLLPANGLLTIKGATTEQMNAGDFRSKYKLSLDDLQDIYDYGFFFQFYEFPDMVFLPHRGMISSLLPLVDCKDIKGDALEVAAMLAYYLQMAEHGSVNLLCRKLDKKAKIIRAFSTRHDYVPLMDIYRIIQLQFNRAQVNSDFMEYKISQKDVCITWKLPAVYGCGKLSVSFSDCCEHVCIMEYRAPGKVLVGDKCRNHDISEKIAIFLQKVQCAQNASFNAVRK